MEIVKYIKLIIPGLRAKSAKKHKVAHVSRKKMQVRQRLGGLAPKPSANSAYGHTPTGDELRVYDDDDST